ncbi:MAG TPA: RHS repeat-associated core domain-containing protein [Pyrinomonadaceae bacterium]|nr:RHS repeat-associated core domain-containing protein [Pyrinomonadaceae bacterium]
MTAAKQTTEGGDAAGYSTGYTYNLSGALIEETYPSGRKVKNVLDNDGDLSMVQSARCGVVNGVTATCSDPQGYFSYAKSFTYNAAGAVTSMQLGNGRWESTTFNSRLQPTQIALGTVQNATDKLKLDYTYNTTGNADNNGNVLSQKITVARSGQTDMVFDQTYTYDSLNRLKMAEEKTGTTTNWKQTFVFDRYGNRNFDRANTTQPASFANPNVTDPSVDAANNRFTSGQGYTYDAAGNVITDAEGRTFTYDGENKQIEVRNSGSSTIGQYYFDGNGKRVKKVVQSTGETTVFVYDGFGKLIAEYSTEQASSPTVNYTATDPLGSPRVITNKQGEVVSRRDFMPFGEEITPDASYRSAALKYGISDGVRQKFTGYQRDEETDLDFAEARYYYNDHGRFTAVDPLLASGKSANPQTFNRYAYTMNRPLILTDAKGLQAGKPPVQSETPRRTFQIVGRTFVPGTMVVRIPITSGVGGGIVVTGYKSETVPSGRELNVVKTNDAVNNILSDYAGKVYQNEHTVRSAIRNTEENKGLADLSSATLSTSVGGSGDTNKTGSVNITTGLSVTLDITNTADIRIQGDNANDALRSSARIALENTPTVTTASPDVPVALTTDEINGLLAGANAVAVSQVEKDLDKNKEVERLAKEAEKTLPRE